MGFKKNDPNINRKGRDKGVLNKDTKAIKVALHHLLEDNLDNLSIWLAEVAKENPAKAISLALNLSEYILPKLARTEVVGNDGADLFKDLQFTFNTAEVKEEPNIEEDEKE